MPERMPRNQSGPATASKRRLQWSQVPAGVRAEIERLAVARGRSLVHFDVYPHNILVAGDRVLLVDWPHARLGAPFLDLITLLTSAAAAGINPEPIVSAHQLTAGIDPHAVDAVLAAQAGFLVSDSLHPAPPGLQPVLDTKMRIGLGALRWLRRRLATIGW